MMNTWEIVAHSDLQALVDELFHCGSHTLTYTTRYTVHKGFIKISWILERTVGGCWWQAWSVKKALLAGSNSVNELIPG